MKFAIFAKEKLESVKIKGRLLEEIGHRHYLLDEENPQYIFVVGGDGTFLRAIHHYIDKLDSVKFIGIMCGTLGFFYDFKEEDIPHIFDVLEKEEYSLEEHQLLECDLGNKKLFAVNEVRFENPFHTLVCSVKVNDIELEKFHGNGLLVCSSLGSTAYNKSLGGAVISRNTDLLELTEISTIQNNVYRSLGSPLILNKDAVISFEGNFDGVTIGYDHLSVPFDTVSMKVHLSDKKLTILYPKDFNYLKPIKRSFIK